jgi:hypothetical protein
MELSAWTRPKGLKCATWMGPITCISGTHAFIITSKQVGHRYNCCAHFLHTFPCP